MVIDIFTSAIHSIFVHIHVLDLMYNYYNIIILYIIPTAVSLKILIF